MVAVAPPKIHFWLFSVIGILVSIISTYSEASSMVGSIETAKVINGSSSRLQTNQHTNTSRNGFSDAPTLLERLEKTSFQCKGKSERLCRREKSGSSQIDDDALQPARATVDLEPNVESTSRQLKLDRNSSYEVARYVKFSGRNNDEYLPVPYGPNGYQDVSEARSWITVPLFIIFSIIQFKLVAAIFLAFFGPMILFLLIVQGFLFKATLVMLGLMMS